MEPTQILICLIFLALIISLIATRVRPEWLFGLAMTGCFAFGFVSTEEILKKAVNPGLVTLLLLILVSAGLEKLDWLQALSKRIITQQYHRSVFFLSVVTAAMSAFINNTAVVAALATSVQSNKHHAASRLLIPLSYAAILGGTTTLIGTSTNLVVNSFLIDAGEQSLQFFDFFIVGALATLVGIVVIVLTSRLLPVRERNELQAAEYFVEAKLRADSAMVGKNIADAGLRNLESLFLIEIVRERHLISPVAPFEVLEAGDILIFSGDVREIATLEQFDGLELFASNSGLLGDNLTEVIVLPGATVVGKTIKNSGFRATFDAAVVGLRRGGEHLSGRLGRLVLRPGDSLLLAVGPDFAERRNIGKNFAVVSGVNIVKHLPPTKNLLTFLGFALVVMLAATGLLPLFKGLVCLLMAMLLLGVVNGEELKRKFPFDLWIIIGSALVLATALTNTGVTDVIANALHSTFTSWGPMAGLIGIFFATLVLTEIMTNNAAAALMFPIAYGLAQSFDVSWTPFVMAVAYGASASFLTPYGYNTNLMVQNIGGYQFKDYTRAGIPVSIAYSLTVLFFLPKVFPF